MVSVATFGEFFGNTQDELNSYEPNDSVDYALQLQLQQNGTNVLFVNPNGTTETISALLFKERREKRETESGFEEEILRDICIHSNPTTGRESVSLFEEVRIGSSKYQVRAYIEKGSFWRITLKRVNVGEMGRKNRRK